ncbi:hypothetical protein GQ457_13G011990 [Hibiscus cannabinus]
MLERLLRKGSLGRKTIKMDERLLQSRGENPDVKYWSESNQHVSGDRVDREAFIDRYEDIAYLLYVQVNEPMLQALIKFWNSSYCCFTLNSIDLVPTVEEYFELLQVPNKKEDRVYTKPKKNTNMHAQLAALTESHCFPWFDIANITRTYPDNLKKAHLLTMAIYVLAVIFPRILGYIDITLFDVFDQFRYGFNPAPAILIETFISLNSFRELEGGRFRGCSQLLYVWIKSHFWKTPKLEEVDPTKWVEAFRNFQEQDLVWRTPWVLTIEYLYRCYDHHWLMLMGLWGAIACAPFLVSRQFGSCLFIPFTAGLRESWFAFDEKFREPILAINKNWLNALFAPKLYLFSQLAS